MGHDHHGHGSNGHGGAPTSHDYALAHTIQPIELVKHNPNVFWVNPWHYGESLEILGGFKFGLFTVAGASLSVAYFNAQNKHIPTSFYKKNFHVWGRLIFGAFIGGAIGFLKFGDRQRLHNAYTADRLFRRYKESRDLSANNLEALRGHKADHSFYRWA